MGSLAGGGFWLGSGLVVADRSAAPRTVVRGAVKPSGSSLAVALLMNPCQIWAGQEPPVTVSGVVGGTMDRRCWA